MYVSSYFFMYGLRHSVLVRYSFMYVVRRACRYFLCCWYVVFGLFV